MSEIRRFSSAEVRHAFEKGYHYAYIKETVQGIKQIMAPDTWDDTVEWYLKHLIPDSDAALIDAVRDYVNDNYPNLKDKLEKLIILK